MKKFLPALIFLTCLGFTHAQGTVSLGVGYGSIGDDYSVRDFRSYSLGLYLYTFGSEGTWGFVSQGNLAALPLDASVDGVSLFTNDTAMIKLAISYMGGLGYKGRISEAVSVHGALGLGMHQTQLLLESYGQLVSPLSIGPAVGAGVHWAVGNNLSLSLVADGAYTLFQPLEMPHGLGSFTGGFNYSFGLLIGNTSSSRGRNSSGYRTLL